MYTYARGTVSLTHAKNIPVGDSMPIAFFSMGRSFVVIFDERFLVKCCWRDRYEDGEWGNGPSPMGGLVGVAAFVVVIVRGWMSP